MMSEKQDENKQEDTQEEPKVDRATELTETVKRIQADFENYRKRMEKNMDDLRKMAGKNMIMKLLPTLDNFSLALKSSPDTDFAKGIELIYSQLISLLQEEGLAEIKFQKEFDPYLHEPLLKIESPEPENTILEILQPGYTLKDQVIRHAKVKLSKGNKKQNDQKKE